MTEKKSHKFRSSGFSRLLKVGGTLASVAGTYALDKASEQSKKLMKRTEQLQDNYNKIKMAKDIISSMGELKGGIMKIGQMLSITEDMILPDEVSQLFKMLQREAPPIPYKQIEKVFIQSFGSLPIEVFAEFDKQPLASASIGQVHKAKLKTGEDVVVKIQYPKIAEAVKSDMQNLDRLEKLFSLFFPKSLNLRPMLEELQEIIINECDYDLEAQAIIDFTDSIVESFPEVQIPKVYKDYSSKTVLTLEYVEGDTFEKTLNYSQEDRDELGNLFYRFFMCTLLKNKFLHTDPQNGNYLFGKNKIILLDFGATKRFDPHFIENYCLLMEAIEWNDRELYRKMGIELGLIHKKDSEDFVNQHFEVVAELYRPYQSKGVYCPEEINPFKMVGNFIKGLDVKQYRAPRREFLMIDRVNVGCFTKLRSWKSRVNWEAGRVEFRHPESKKALDRHGFLGQFKS